MGLFSIFKYTPKFDKDLELAWNLIKQFYLGGVVSEEARQFTQKAKSKHDVLDKAIKLCKNKIHPEAYFITARAYKLKGAKYRLEVIKNYNKYLKNPTFDRFGGKSRIASIHKGGKWLTPKSELSDTYLHLGDAYSGEYQFDRALKCFEESLKLDPDNTSAYCRLAEVYYKLHNLDMSIKILEDAKKTKYYRKPRVWTSPVDKKKHIDETFKIVIDRKLEEYQDKKRRGQVYRPRKQNK